MKTGGDTAKDLHNWMDHLVRRDNNQEDSATVEALKEAAAHMLDMGVHRIEVAQGRSSAGERRLREELAAEEDQAAGQEETLHCAKP